MDEPRPGNVTRAAQVVERMQEWACAHGEWRTAASINLIAANNVMSTSARAALSSRLADKPISGTLGRRHHMGGHYADLIEIAVVDLVKELFGVTTVEYRPMSGNQANTVAIFALLRPGDTIMALPLGAPCHHSQRVPAEYLGVRIVDTPFDYDSLEIDLEGMRRVVCEEQPRLIVVGTAQMLFPYPLIDIRSIADEVGALVLYDGAHPLGLIAGGRFQSPMAEGAHVLTGSTQKTLPGPIGGLVMTNDEVLGQSIADTAARMISNYQNNRILSLGITLAEMLAFGREYATACLENAQILARVLQDDGFALLGSKKGCTRSNKLILDVRDREDARTLSRAWEQANLMTTVVTLPSPCPQRGAPPNGIRIGVQEVTRLGMGPEEMEKIGRLMARVQRGENPESVGRKVAELARQFQQVHYSFDSHDHPLPGDRHDSRANAL